MKVRLINLLLLAAVTTAAILSPYFQQPPSAAKYDTASPVSVEIEPAVAWSPIVGTLRSDELNLLTRTIAAEATGEPFEGQVAVGSVILNRVKNPSFPNSISGVIYQPLAFESVSNGLVWRVYDLNEARRAAQLALNGWDPTYGCLYFWNPNKPVSPWIWTRNIIRQIGRHVFGI